MIKSKLKAAVVATALAFAGSANAAIDNGGTGNGELFFSAWDSASQTSYTRDLGVTMSQFLTNTGTFTNVAGGSNNVTSLGYSLVFAVDATLSGWLSGLANPNAIRWNVAAMDGSGADRYLTTGPAALGALPNNQLLEQWNDNPSTHLANVNSGPWVSGSHAPANGSSVIAAASNANGYSDAAVWRDNWAGRSTFSNAGTGLGSSTFFYALFQSGGPSGGTAFNPVSVDQYDNAAGASTWTFASDGTLTFMSPDELAPVPLPAAVWLFGSGLFGLVAISRRKRQAAAAKPALA